MRQLIKEKLDKLKRQKMCKIILDVLQTIEGNYDGVTVTDPSPSQHTYLIHKMTIKLGAADLDDLTHIDIDLDVQNPKIWDNAYEEFSESCRWQAIEAIKSKLVKLKVLRVQYISMWIMKDGKDPRRTVLNLDMPDNY